MPLPITKKKWLDLPSYTGEDSRDIGMRFRTVSRDKSYIIDVKCGLFDPTLGDYKTEIVFTSVFFLPEE